jgi:hypothetical protein
MMKASNAILRNHAEPNVQPSPRTISTKMNTICADTKVSAKDVAVHAASVVATRTELRAFVNVLFAQLAPGASQTAARLVEARAAVLTSTAIGRTFGINRS